MNRSAKHKVSGPRDQPASHHAGQEMPYWSDYLVRLGAQVKKAANTTIWTGKPVAPNVSEYLREPAEQGVVPRIRNADGDRRMNVERRREFIDISNSPLDTGALQQEALSDYLARLGQQSEQTARLRVPPEQDVRENRIEPSRPGARYGIRRPVGDRRAGSMQRRKRAASLDARPDTGKWLYFLPRLWGRMTAKTRRATDQIGAVSLAGLSLGMWGYYFIAKLGMYWAGLIAFHTMENLVFAAFILLPASSRILYRAKNILAAMLAISLLYYDSWLPSVSRLLSQASLLSNFSFAYLFELLSRFFSWQTVGLLLASGLVYRIVSRYVRVGVLVIISMLALALIQYYPVDIKVADTARPDMDRVLQEFFAKEADRSVLFVTPQASATPFDVIFIHVCSLSWDDVRAVGLEAHPLWKRFDILMMNFNSAASYSGPAVLHLMRAKCGQPPHGDLYTPAADKCYLMNSLQLGGFEPSVALNHDGKFDDFLGQLKKHGRVNAPPLPLNGLVAAQYAFDKSPVYDDLSVLDRWLAERQKSASSRVALYYNTISMHDGNHMPGVDSAPNTPETYKARLTKFLDETESFMQKLEASGRRAVVVMVPEHGAAVRGDKRQITGLREIPTPAITLVPVGIKVIGGRREGDALLIAQPVSYLAISQMIERMLEKSPFDNNSFAPSDYVDDLLITPFVAQNETTTVANYGNRYYLGRGVGKWEVYDEFNKPAVTP
ncbi:MAG: cellulose biosynthesis protein BcsG [Proteobacteria bacterium]|nr:cellulose biosynthesis protein BcsG [Pseudomonadota bacterium]